MQPETIFIIEEAIKMTIDEMKTRKRELGYTNEMISELSGVPLGTVQKLFAGFTSAPRKKTIDAIEKVLSRKQISYDDVSARPASVIRESEPAYAVPSKGPYTIDDYMALPEDVRVELIDGYFYDMASPRQIHQGILGQLHLLFAQCMEEMKKNDCWLFFAPFDVQLDMDKYTVVQPDLLIICGLNKIPKEKGYVYGAPDLALEVLSPTSRSHDMILKLRKYMNAGVREYWIVDPENEAVLVYYFEENDLPRRYDFSDTVPVSISGGHCRIDFKIIKTYLDALNGIR